MLDKAIPINKRVKLDNVAGMVTISGSTSEEGSILAHQLSQNEMDERGILHNLFISPLPDFLKKMWTQISGSSEKEQGELQLSTDSQNKIINACSSHQSKPSDKQSKNSATSGSKQPKFTNQNSLTSAATRDSFNLSCKSNAD